MFPRRRRCVGLLSQGVALPLPLLRISLELSWGSLLLSFRACSPIFLGLAFRWGGVEMFWYCPYQAHHELICAAHGPFLILFAVCFSHGVVDMRVFVLLSLPPTAPLEWRTNKTNYLELGIIRIFAGAARFTFRHSKVETTAAHAARNWSYKFIPIEICLSQVCEIF